MTLFTPHTARRASEECRIVGILPGRRCRVELMTNGPDGPRGTREYRVYPYIELGATGGLAEIKAAMAAVEAGADAAREERVASRFQPIPEDHL